MDGRVPDFQFEEPDSITVRVGDFNSYSGTGCVSFVCVLSCVVSGGGPAIPLTPDFREARPCVSISWSVPKSVLPLQASDAQAFGFKSPGGGW